MFICLISLQHVIIPSIRSNVLVMNIFKYIQPSSQDLRSQSFTTQISACFVETRADVSFISFIRRLIYLYNGNPTDKNSYVWAKSFHPIVRPSSSAGRRFTTGAVDGNFCYDRRLAGPDVVSSEQFGLMFQIGLMLPVRDAVLSSGGCI